jgi:hypothetical protein
MNRPPDPEPSPAGTTSQQSNWTNAERGHAHVSDRGEVQLWILSGDAHPSGSRSATRIVRSS